MNRSPRVRPDGDAAEHLPGGAGADAQDDLSRLLAAVSAPAHPDELAGEEAAMSAFRAHHAGRSYPAGQLGSTAGQRSVPATVAKFLTVKVAIVSALTVAATGGVALAATTGALPGALGGDRWAGAPARQHGTPRPSVPTGTASTGSPQESPHDLCRTYQIRTSEGEGGMLDDPQFGTLIEAAGGRNEVAGYCVGLLGPADVDEPEPPASADPSGPPNGRPGHPTGKPSYPPGKPTAPPNKPDKPGSGPPTAQQSGRPTAQPNNRS